MNELFRFHKLNENGIQKALRIAGSFDRLLKDLSQSCPDCREFSIAKTKLEEACFFAKKAMATHNINQSSDTPGAPLQDNDNQENKNNEETLND